MNRSTAGGTLLTWHTPWKGKNGGQLEYPGNNSAPCATRPQANILQNNANKPEEWQGVLQTDGNTVSQNPLVSNTA